MRAVLLLLAVALAAPFAGADPAGAVPLAGDAAEYVLVADGASRRVVLEWTVEDVWLPTGETRPLATLRASLLDGAAAAALLNPFADDAPAPVDAAVVALHWTRFPGPPVAWSASWLDATDGDARWATRTALGGCADAAWLLRWADPSCAADARVEARGPSGLPGRVEGPGWTLDAVGHRRGHAPLPSDPAPLGAPPRVETTTWTREGPARGDLPEYGFAAARAALVAGDGDAAAFLLTRDEARVLQARRAWSTVAEAGDEPWAARLKGVPCVAAPAQRVPGGEWSAGWVDDRGSLFALVQRIGAPVPLDRVLAASLDSYRAQDAGGAPATEAATPVSLASHLGLVPAAAGDVATLDYDFLPSGALASVSRGACALDPATGRMAYAGASLTFHPDGDVTALTLRAQRERPLLPEGLAPAGAPAAPPRGGLERPPAGAVAATAAVAFALLLAAALYGRIRKDAALAHATRARVFAQIERAPGASVQDVARALRIPRGTVEHHVRTLARSGYVRVADGPRGKALHPSARAPAAHEALLARRHAADLLRLVRERPGATQSELGAALGMRKSHLSELVRDLADAGLVARERRGRRVHVRPVHGSAGS